MLRRVAAEADRTAPRNGKRSIDLDGFRFDTTSVPQEIYLWDEDASPSLVDCRTLVFPNSSEDVQGTEVYGPDGKHIGEIDHLIIDKLSGRVAYAVMSFGGFLGLGHRHYPIPWGALRYDASLGGFRTNVTEQQLKDAPEFSDDSWQDRDWETRTHRHYGTQGYWESRSGL
jgi:PRC-barrel domain